ncbi:MAG: AAA family ATPase [Clostridiales bacterium]|nr:AAA family ATPase [Clostridiales bacterium]
MIENDSPCFKTSKTLEKINKAYTENNGIKFEQRDFVEPLYKFCTNEIYDDGKLGIVFGLRFTGKTVGMLQVAELLVEQGYKVAYAKFMYQDSGLLAISNEIEKLADKGYTHFFVDEASRLYHFVNYISDWSERLIMERKIKIVISGKDNFLIWTVQRSPLLEQYVEFATNFMSFPEYKRLTGESFSLYKANGGIFKTPPMVDYIHSAIVENLMNTIECCTEEADYISDYARFLYGIQAFDIYKSIASIFKCIIEIHIKEQFSRNNAMKNIPDMGIGLSKSPGKVKENIIKRVASSILIYTPYRILERPFVAIGMIIEFLSKIGCLLEIPYGSSDLPGSTDMSYAFCHNALMSYCLKETVTGMLKNDIGNREPLADGIWQAAEDCLNENIIKTHIAAGIGTGDTFFKYHDIVGRKIDAVIINREVKTLILIEVNSDRHINQNTIFRKEAVYLFNNDIIDNIGIDNTFKITRVIVYYGENEILFNKGKALLLVNIENFLEHFQDLGGYFDQLRE